MARFDILKDGKFFYEATNQAMAMTIASSASTKNYSTYEVHPAMMGRTGYRADLRIAAFYQGEILTDRVVHSGAKLC